MPSRHAPRRSSPILGWGLLLLLSGVPAWAVSLKATVVDRDGNRHNVAGLRIRASKTLEFYVDGRRRQLEMARIERLRIGGNERAQEVPVTVTLRTGRVEEGTIVINASSSPNEDIVAGGVRAGDRVTGRTPLGPLFLPLNQVREILFEHPADQPLVTDEVSGSIVDERGKLFQLKDIRYRGDDAFRFRQGRKKRRVALRHVERIEFGDSPTGEMRPVTILYRNGRVVQGQVDASIVRLAGEGNKVYYARVDSAFTGILPTGRGFGIGLQNLKLVLFETDEKEAAADSTAAADSSATPADSVRTPAESTD